MIEKKDQTKVSKLFINRALIFCFLFLQSVSFATPIPKALIEEKPTLSEIIYGEPPSPIFDIPVTYNSRVARWIKYYQTSGQSTFKKWLERSYKFFPMIKRELERNKLPKDLAYMVMIESGFAPHAKSSAEAVGPWQFIESTANRYGLRTLWWLDERRDFRKSTLAAIRYVSDLYNEFESWYLVAASYNMGENGLRRIIQKYRTKDYWKLIQLGALPSETAEYVPKLLAAMLVAKAPSLYGFRSIKTPEPLEYQVVNAPAGTKLDALADFLGVTRQSLRELNTELKVGFIPKEASYHPIHVPHGALSLAKQFIAQTSKNVAMD
jgi:membrane-bound lytic murein transglycosylase D